MGVPRFYRWLAKRYPAFRCAADAGTQPHVDNLYLDLNGIVHQCARHDRGPSVPAAPNNEIFAEVFAQISAIVDLVGPQKLLFLGLDGVAPRAKLNQQRARRFVAAQDKPQRDDHESEPPWFDGNCITPGTEFMHALGDALAFLVRQKMGEDSQWSRIDVVLSTTAVPGEGEHKIMEYIRQRNDPPGTIHCAYGADADLILLALAAHEPHFLVIREIPDYSGMRPAVGGPEARPQRSCAAMEYMSISVLREYLRLDLCSPAAADFFDIERAIDDFVLCSFLCGNDFLPHLPCVDIADGALDAIVLLYRKLLPEWRDYLTHDGEVVLDRFESFLKELSILEPLVLGMKSPTTNQPGRRGRRNLTGNEITSNVLRAVNTLWEDRIEHSDSTDVVSTKQVLLQRPVQAGKRPGDWTCARCAVNNFARRIECFKCSAPKPALQDSAPDRCSEDDDDWVEQIKREYYAQKLGIGPHGAQQRKVCREFLKGMAWTLKYYVSGCPSWGWFYPFHYAPFLSDMVGLRHHCLYDIGFDLGRPYTPLQQLLAVLPPGSAWALPGAYRRLMLEEGSSIRDFYPKEFTQDANGKRNDWEATILLDFIDDRRLRDAAASADSQLTPLESKRNRFAPPLRFRWTHGVRTPMCLVRSPLPELFPDMHSTVSCWEERDAKASPGSSPATSRYKAELRPGATSVPPPNPTLPVLWHTTLGVAGGLETPGGVYAFGESKSTNNSVVLSLLDSTTRVNESVDAYKSLIGTVISINWPWQQLAVCVGLLTENGHIGDAGLGHLQFNLENQAILYKFRTERGLHLPTPTIIVYARPIRYAAVVSSGYPLYETDDILAYPLSCVGQVDANDWRIAERIAPPLKLGSQAVVIDKSSAYFGGLCRVIKDERGQLSARIECRPTSSFASVVAFEMDSQDAWMTIDELCEAVQLSSSVVQQIVQDLHFRFQKQPHDVGLHFRFFKRGLLRAGYVRRKGHCMQGPVIYSPKAVDCIQAYKALVPELFHGLATVDTKRAENKRIGKGTAGQPFVAAELFGQDVAKSVLQRCGAFRDSYLVELLTEPLYNNCSAVLGSTSVKELERYLDAEQPQHTIEMHIDQKQLLLPGALTDTQHEAISGASSPARATLGSRVCYTMSSGPCAFGTLGLVVGIHPPRTSSETSIGWTLDIIIQSTVKQQRAIGGTSLGGRCSALRGVSVPASHVVNVGTDSFFPETDCADNGCKDEETLVAIREQVEFYLSDKNLPKDSYFRPLVQMHPEGFLAISKLLACKRIRCLTSDSSVVAAACHRSEDLVVSVDRTAIRRAQPWAPLQRVKNKQSKKQLAKWGTTEKQLHMATPVACTVEVSESCLRSERKPRAEQEEPPKSVYVQRVSCEGAISLSTTTGGTLLAVVTTIAAAQIPQQYKRHTVLALSAWPTCLLIGQALAQSMKPTRTGILKKTARQETNTEMLSAKALGVASGIAVVACRYIQSSGSFFEDPSATRAAARLQDDRVAKAAPSRLPPSLASNAGAAVVALTFMPFGYVCGANFFK